MITEFFQIGVIASTHGLHGEVNVFPTTDDKQRFKKLKKCILEDKRNGRREVEIVSCKFTQKFVILKFKGMDRIEDVDRLKTCPLLVSREDAMPLAKNEYYASDLYGLKVIDEDENEIGEVVEVITTGANDVYEVKRPEGENILLPAIKQCILDIDIEKGIMKIHIMDGLIPEE